MRLKAAITISLVCALASTALAVEPAKPAPPQRVWVAKCNKLARSAAFVGAMRQVKGGEEMAMRFKLLERILPGKAFQPVDASGLNVWRKARPGVRRFSFRQRVRALAEAAIYKVEVEFRWEDAEGEVVRQVIERSRRCRQPGALPNLQVKNVVYHPTQGRYGVRVANVGRDEAVGAMLQLFVDGKESDLVSVPTLAPGAEELLPVSGPPCLGSVQAVVDPTALVRESVEDDNALTEPCASVQDRR